MRLCQTFLRNDFEQRLFGCKGILQPGILFRNKPYSVGHPQHVGVHRHAVFSKAHRKHDVGSLAPNAGKLLQLLEVLRHLAAVVRHELLRKPYHILCLCAVHTDGADELRNLGDSGFLVGTGGTRERLRVGVFSKKCRCNLVHTFIRSLGRKHHRNQKLIDAPMVEGALSFGISMRKDIQHFANFFFR